MGPKNEISEIWRRIQKTLFAQPCFRGSWQNIRKIDKIQSKNRRKTNRLTMHFVHDTTPRLIGVTSRSTARKCSPDSVECAKIVLTSRNLMYLVFWLGFVMRHLPEISGFAIRFANVSSQKPTKTLDTSSFMLWGQFSHILRSQENTFAPLISFHLARSCVARKMPSKI